MKQQGAEKHPKTSNIVQKSSKMAPKINPGGLRRPLRSQVGAQRLRKRPPGAQKNNFGDPKRRQERFLSDVLEIGGPNGVVRRHWGGPGGMGFGESKLRLDVG